MRLCRIMASRFRIINQRTSWWKMSASKLRWKASLATSWAIFSLQTPTFPVKLLQPSLIKFSWHMLKEKSHTRTLKLIRSWRLRLGRIWRVSSTWTISRWLRRWQTSLTKLLRLGRPTDTRLHFGSSEISSMVRRCTLLSWSSPLEQRRRDCHQSTGIRRWAFRKLPRARASISWQVRRALIELLVAWNEKSLCISEPTFSINSESNRRRRSWMLKKVSFCF